MRSLSCALAVALSIATTSLADDFVVTKEADGADGSCDVGDCSLREAVIAANLLAGPDRITLPSGTYVLSLGGSDDDVAATGDLDLTDDVEIVGGGAASTSVEAGLIDPDPVRVFHVDPGAAGIEVEIRDLAMGAPADERSAGLEGRCLHNSGSLTLRRVSIRDCHGASAGGGAYNAGELVLEQSTVEECSGTHGGGLYSAGANALLSVSDSTIANNEAESGDGGGILNADGALHVERSRVTGNRAGFFGGGINSSGTGSSVTLIDSTIDGNDAAIDGGGVKTFGTLNAVNSTVSGNTAPNGAGLRLLRQSSLTNVTVHGNIADPGSPTSSGGGISALTQPNLLHTIVAGNTDLSGAAPDCDGTMLSRGYSMIGDDTGCTVFSFATGDQIGTAESPVDPGLGPLEDNGGPTPTHYPETESPAVDAGDPAGCTWDDDLDGVSAAIPLSSDQRGAPRPTDGNGSVVCDLGAVEVPEPRMRLLACVALIVLGCGRRRAALDRSAR